MDLKNLNNCFIDLHLHLDGSLSVASIRSLARLTGTPLELSDAELKEKISVSPDCRNLNEYLEKFDFALSFLQTQEAITASVKLLLEELSRIGVIYAEIRFAPQLHMQKGLTQEQAVAAAVKGTIDSPIPCGLILCLMRGSKNLTENRDTVRTAQKFLGKGVVAIDLAGAEGLFATKDFEDVFDLAHHMDIPFTIHAGEGDGPESVKAALSFGAKRIGHGIRSLEDPELIKKLAENHIPLEMCPTSNINTCVADSYFSYPIRPFLEAGIPITINSDNISVSNTDVVRDFKAVCEAQKLTDSEIRTLLHNSVDALFANDMVKFMLHSIVDRELKKAGAI